MRTVLVALLLAATLTLAFLTTYKRKPPSDTPAQVATKLIHALQVGDSGTVAQLIIPEQRPDSVTLTRNARARLDGTGETNVTEVHHNGNTATVRVALDIPTAEAARLATPNPTHYGELRDELARVLSAEAFTILFETLHWEGFYEPTAVSDRMPIMPGESLHERAGQPLDTATLERYLANPPALDHAALQQIEAIAADVAAEPDPDLHDARARLRPRYARLADHLLYTRYLRPGPGQVGVDHERGGYYLAVDVTLHQIEGRWLAVLE